MAPATEGLAGHVGGPGSSGNAENGSHLAGEGAAEGHAVQVDCSGSSGNAGIGSHLAVASVTDAAGTHAAVVAAARWLRHSMSSPEKSLPMLNNK